MNNQVKKWSNQTNEHKTTECVAEAITIVVSSNHEWHGNGVGAISGSDDRKSPKPLDLLAGVCQLLPSTKRPFDELGIERQQQAAVDPTREAVKKMKFTYREDPAPLNTTKKDPALHTVSNNDSIKSEGALPLRDAHGDAGFLKMQSITPKHIYEVTKFWKHQLEESNAKVKVLVEREHDYRNQIEHLNNAKRCFFADSMRKISNRDIRINQMKKELQKSEQHLKTMRSHFENEIHRTMSQCFQMSCGEVEKLEESHKKEVARLQRELQQQKKCVAEAFIQATDPKRKEQVLGNTKSLAETHLDESRKQNQELKRQLQISEERVRALVVDLCCGEATDVSARTKHHRRIEENATVEQLS